jgi:hypothetical protein
MDSPTLFDRWRQVDEAATAAETAVFEATLAVSRGGQGPTQAQWDLARKLRGQAASLYQLACFVHGDEPLRHGVRPAGGHRGSGGSSQHA